MTGGLRRTLLEIAAAVAVSAAATVFLALPAGDPFRGTLLILPLVAVALRAVERSAGARIAGSTESRVAVWCLGGLLLLTLGRHRLGLVVTDPFLAAGFGLLLAHRVARLLVGLRPLLGRRLPPRPSWAFFALPLIVYLAVQPWSAAHRQPDGDEPFYLLLAHSLAYDFDVDLADNYAAGDWRRFMEREIEPQPGDPVGAAGEVYSRHSFLLPLGLAPAYRLAGRAGAMAVMAALSAWLAFMVLRLGRHYAPQRPGAVLLAYGIFAFSPPLLLYSYQIWVEVPAALLVALGLDRVLDLARERSWGAPRLVALSLPVVLLPILKLRFGILALCLLALLWLRARPNRAALGWASGALITALAGLLGFNALRYANPLRIHSWQELDLFRHDPVDFIHGAVGMFYDCAFGLFPNAPIWLLLIAGLGWGLCRRSSLVLDIAVLTLPYLILIAPRLEWYGGWSPPFRYPLVSLPLLALLLVPVLARRSRAAPAVLLAALGGVTLILAIVWVVAPGWTYNFADGRALFLDQASARLGGDVARFFPSTVRPRAATWVWVVGSLLLIPLTLGSGRRRRGSVAIWGVAAVLLFASALTLGSRLAPTRVLHFEDPFVSKDRGRLFPDPWTLQRIAYRGGWAMPEGGQVVAPVVAGGERVTIRLQARFYAPEGHATVRLQAGEAILATEPVVWKEWRELEIGPIEWKAGAPLVLGRPAELQEFRGMLVVDRAELEWR